MKITTEKAFGIHGRSLNIGTYIFKMSVFVFLFDEVVPVIIILVLDKGLNSTARKKNN